MGRGCSKVELLARDLLFGAAFFGSDNIGQLRFLDWLGSFGSLRWRDVYRFDHLLGLTELGETFDRDAFSTANASLPVPSSRADLLEMPIKATSRPT